MNNETGEGFSFSMQEELKCNTVNKLSKQKQVCAQPSPLAVNMTLPAVAAEHRRLLFTDIYAGRVLSSKPTKCHCR